VSSGSTCWNGLLIRQHKWILARTSRRKFRPRPLVLAGIDESRRWHNTSSSSSPTSTACFPTSPPKTYVPSLVPQFPLTSVSQTYLAGESYAGQYIPYIAHALLYPPYPLPSTLSSLALKGLLIGNGWISPLDQYPAYLDFALQSGIVKKGSETEKKVRKDVDDCVKQLLEGGRDKVKIHNGNCEGILSAITDSTVQS
jgi:hypothetical protein